jgi:5-methylcytosine-specific restriction endonuclease McrA
VSYQMRCPCKYGCGTTDGYLEPKNGQDMIYCRECRKHQYNAPKAETGRATRSVSTTHEAIKPKQRARIVLRANHRCELCHADRILHVGHLLSVAEGHKQGLSDTQINSDENLAAMCEECNLGLSDETIPQWLAVAIVKARTGSGTVDSSPTMASGITTEWTPEEWEKELKSL